MNLIPISGELIIFRCKCEPGEAIGEAEELWVDTLHVLQAVLDVLQEGNLKVLIRRKLCARVPAAGHDQG